MFVELQHMLRSESGTSRHFAARAAVCRFRAILLQKSKVATPRIFREDKRWETIADSYTLNRVAEIAGEFDARGHVPPHLYTEDAPTARRIFDHLCKTTFATVSPESDS